MQCKNCGAEVGIEYRLCPYCHSEIDYPSRNQGNNQAQQPIIIQNIISDTNSNRNADSNRNNVDYRNFQPDCSPTACSPKNKVVTLILCILLGYFGVHRFYAGKVGSGILYFFTLGLFYFGWIYDIIKIASGTFKDGNGLPITK